jgi:hypothetical protein
LLLQIAAAISSWRVELAIGFAGFATRFDFLGTKMSRKF